jgi:hypothetical protein
MSFPLLGAKLGKQERKYQLTINNKGNTMKSKKQRLALAISVLLMTTIASYPAISYADSASERAKEAAEHAAEQAKENAKKAAEKASEDAKKASETAAKATAAASYTPSADSDNRGSGDAKVTICHIPTAAKTSANADTRAKALLNKHTIHISFNAWAAHKANHGGDYLGSCNRVQTAPDPVTKQPIDTTTKLPVIDTTSSEIKHIISDCTGSARETLLTKVQSYYDPVTVVDTALDDEVIATAVSQCLDNGDSGADSNHAAASRKTSTGKIACGKGRDSVSDSGHHHRIRGCKNEDSGHKADSNDKSKHGRSDSDKNDAIHNFHKKLKAADSEHDTKHGIKDPTVVSDSSLSDSGVWKEYKKCAGKSGDARKIDSNKVGKKKGDSGHKQHVVKSCDNDSGLKQAIEDHKEKAKTITTTKDILLTETSYNDIWVKAAVDACVADGAKDTPVLPVTPDTTTTTTTTGGGIGMGTGGGGGTVNGGTTSGGVSGRVSWREITTPASQ